MVSEKGRERIILMAAILGIILAAYAVTLHYSPEGSSFCHIGPTFDCDKVNKSPWSVLFGIPVAILGLFSYLAFFYAVLFRKRIQRFLSFTEKDVWQYLLLFTIVMFGFQLYLTAMEVFFIHAYCIVCLGSQLVTLTVLIATFGGYKKASNKLEK